MALKAMPMISGTLYLGDLSDRVKEAEGKCPETERAWVIVRQGTEADNQDRAALRSEVSLTYGPSGAMRETRDVNMRKMWEMEVYRCLCDAGNILNANDKPLFAFSDKGPYKVFDGGLAEFQTAYGSLQSFITQAIRQAVYTLNPDWDWTVAAKAESQTAKAKGEGQDSGEE